VAQRGLEVQLQVDSETGPNRVLFFETCTPISNRDQGNPFRRNDFSSKSTPGQPGRPMPGTRFGPLSLTSGNQVLLMDPYVVHYPRQKRNLPLSPEHGIGTAPDPRWENFRNTLGDLVRYARRLKLNFVTPRGALSSTGFCLAQTPPAGAEYLVDAPSGGAFTVDVSAMPDTRTLAVEWFDPATGTAIPQGPLPAGSRSRSFTPPFRGDAVLYLVDTAGHRR
jgi:hypothetical protein